jgi:hypothetical protein
MGRQQTALLHQAQFSRVFRTQKQIQIRIPPRFPIAPAPLPVRAPMVTHAVAHHLDWPRYSATPHVENEFSATSTLGHFRFGFRRTRSRFIFHRVFQVNTTASMPMSTGSRPQPTSPSLAPNFHVRPPEPTRDTKRTVIPIAAPAPRSFPLV